MNKPFMRQRANAAWSLWLIAAWFGLVCGLLEGVQYLIFSQFPGQIPWELRWLGISEKILWVAPAFNLFIFLAVVAPAALLALFVRKVELQHLAIFFFFLASFYDLLSLTGRLHGITVLVLSTGLSLSVCRWLRSRNLDTVALMHKSFPYIAGLVVLLVAATTIGTNLLEREQTRGLPQPDPDAPNVLLIVLDTLRADHLSSYGYSRATSPNIDRIAKQGVLFEEAIANSSWTVPSHASLMTGKYVSTHCAGSERPLDDKLPTLSEEFAQRGYATAGFVANTYWAGRRSGFARGFIHFEDYFGSIGDMIARTGYGRKLTKHVLPRLGYNNLPGRKCATDINTEFLEWLKTNRDRQFFGFLNYLDVHDPYIPPPPYRAVFSDRVDNGRSVNFLKHNFFVAKALSPEEIQMAIDAYDSSLVYLDAELGSLFSALDNLGLSENTLVIITSDHGESFGNHGIFAHGNSLYLEQIHVPLIIRYPQKIRAGWRVSTPVGLHSIYATITELLDLEKHKAFSADTLTRFLVAENPEQITSLPVLSEISRNINAPESWPNSKGWLKSLVTSKWHFILNETRQVELYNIQNDPNEFENLADSPVNRVIVEDFKKQLEQILLH